ncbi:MAG: hypothetical protein ACR2MB_07415, partial [Acidimicrobiales bacterium]
MKLPTGEVGSNDVPKASTVAEPAGKSRPSPQADTLVDLQDLSAGEPNHIDPATADTVQGAQIPVLLYNGLTDTDYDGKIVPALAEKWDVNIKGTEFVFHLKSGETFSNGEA